MSKGDHGVLVVLVVLLAVLSWSGLSVRAHGDHGEGHGGGGGAAGGGQPTHVPGQPYNADELWDTQVLQNSQHIQEDLEEFFNMKKENMHNMTHKELEYYYFELHDFDKNRMLDGLELLKAIVHMVQHSGQEIDDPAALNVDNFAFAIDQVLQTDDLDQDGYLSYAEFVLTMKKNEERNAKMQKEAAKHEEA